MQMCELTNSGSDRVRNTSGHAAMTKSLTTDQVREAYSDIWGDHGDNREAEFNRWLNDRNPWPMLDVRYDAAKAANLGDQLRPDELTERVRIELGNAFAAGALWQYGRGQEPKGVGK